MPATVARSARSSERGLSGNSGRRRIQTIMRIFTGKRSEKRFPLSPLPGELRAFCLPWTGGSCRSPPLHPEISGYCFRTVPGRLSNCIRFLTLPFGPLSTIQIEHNRKSLFIGHFRHVCAKVHPEIKKLFEAAHVVTWFRAQNTPRNHPEKHTGIERKTQENKGKAEQKKPRKRGKKSKRKSLQST